MLSEYVNRLGNSMFLKLKFTEAVMIAIFSHLRVVKVPILFTFTLLVDHPFVNKFVYQNLLAHRKIDCTLSIQCFAVMTRVVTDLLSVNFRNFWCLFLPSCL